MKEMKEIIHQCSSDWQRNDLKSNLTQSVGKIETELCRWLLEIQGSSWDEEKDWRESSPRLKKARQGGAARQSAAQLCAQDNEHTPAGQNSEISLNF